MRLLRLELEDIYFSACFQEGTLTIYEYSVATQRENLKELVLLITHCSRLRQVSGGQKTFSTGFGV